MEYRTIQPTGVYYRYTSGDWTYVERLWDGNVSTKPNKQGTALILKLDLSWLPSGSLIKQITGRYYYERKSGSPSLTIKSSNKDSYQSTEITDVKEIDLPSGTYGVAEYHEATVTLTKEESDLFLSKKYQLILISKAGTSVGYELYLDIGYELPGIPIFVGPNQASEIYVGGTKAKAVYIGSTKIL